MAIPPPASPIMFTKAELEKKTLADLKDLAEAEGLKEAGVGWPTCCPPDGNKGDIVKALLRFWQKNQAKEPAVVNVGVPVAAPVAVAKDEKPHWVSAMSDTIEKEESAKDLQVAVGALAKAATVAVAGYLSGFTALLPVVDSLENMVMNMSWKSESSKEEKALVEYHEESGAYCVLKVSRQTSAKDVGVGILSTSTKTVRLKINFKRAVAKNQAARDVCQSLMDAQADDLVKFMEKMSIFGDKPSVEAN